jgi:hypothetical protein
MLASVEIWAATVSMERDVAPRGRANQHVCAIMPSAMNRHGLNISLGLKNRNVSLIQKER